MAISKKKVSIIDSIWSGVDTNEMHSPKHWLSTGSFLLDLLVGDGRGWAMGRIVENLGNPDTGKTSIALSTARVAQKLGGMCLYLNSESPLNQGFLKDTGIDVNDKQFRYVETESMEKCFMSIDKVVSNYLKMELTSPLLVVWDTVAGTATDMEREIRHDWHDKMQIMARAKKVSDYLRMGIVQDISNRNILIILNNHLKDTIIPTTPESPGGKAIKFFASSRNVISRTSILYSGDSPIGIRIKARNIKSKVSIPYRHVEFNFMFKGGMDNRSSLIDFLTDNKAIWKNGAFLRYEDKNWRRKDLIDHLLDKAEFEKFKSIAKGIWYGERTNISKVLSDPGSN